MDAHDYTAVAYTYAWWLTGDEQAAGAAVRAAVGDPAVLAAAGADRLPALLAAVRSTSGPTPTMCPASEVALLHDAHGLDLDAVAGLAAVDLADVRTELAHGRLEALTETVLDPFVHPERLGGLAVGNPSDVAHARQCDSCGQARDLLERGRTELRELAAVSVPEDLHPPGPPARARLSRGRRVAIGVLLAVAAAAIGVLALSWEGATGDVDATSSADGGVTAVATAVPPALPELPALGRASDAAAEPDPESESQPDPGTEPDPDAAAEPDPDAVAPPDPTAGPAPDPGIFAVESAGLVGPEAELQQSGSTLPPTEPLRLAVRYRGADEGVVLTGRWTVEGVPFREIAVELTVPATTHIIGAPAPPEGWPPGTHEIYLSADGSITAVVAFTVA